MRFFTTYVLWTQPLTCCSELVCHTMLKSTRLTIYSILVFLLVAQFVVKVITFSTGTVVRRTYLFEMVAMPFPCNGILLVQGNLPRVFPVFTVNVTRFSSIPYYSNMRLISKVELEQKFQSTTIFAWSSLKWLFSYWWKYGTLSIF